MCEQGVRFPLVSGFDSRVRLVAISHLSKEQSDGVGSPERSPSSRDAAIACVVSSQKRGVDMTRGNYDSANNMPMQVWLVW